MPAAAQFTPAFIESFVLTCRAEGLTKEATADLLDLAMLTAAHQSPAFAEGFTHRLAVEGNGIEKSAMQMLRQAAPMLRRALPGAAVAGGVGLLGHKAYEAFQGHNRGVWPDAPSIGGYDAEAAKKNEAATLQNKSTGLGELNKQVDTNGKRRAELQAVVNSGGPGAANAIGELQRLRSDPSAGQRSRYGKQLDSYGQETASALSTAQEDLKDLSSARNSRWSKLRSFVGFPRDFDREERELVGQTGRLAEQNRVTSELQRRLKGGYTGGNPDEVISPQDLQSRFFRTQ